MLRTKCILRLISHNVQSTCQASSKKRADNIKKLMKEYKSVFGELIETQAQKKKRLKLERKGVISEQDSNENDTELFWVLQNSQKNLKKIVVPAKPQDHIVDSQVAKNVKDGSVPKETETVQRTGDNISNSSTVAKDINNDKSTRETPCVNIAKENIAKEDNNIHNGSHLSNISDIENANATHNVNSDPERLPDIIIKNLPSFPIMSKKPESLMQSSEVLSISGKNDLKTMKFPSVTKILTQTMPLESKLALEAWKERMIAKLGQDGFMMHQKALLEDGASLHSCIAQNLLGREFQVPPRIEPVFKSVQSVLGYVQHVRAIETHVAHTKLRYKGVVDCVASYRGENYVIDWKKSDKKKSNLKETYDGPVQVAAYIGAINTSNLYPFVIKRGLLVIAYTCGTPATVYEICDNTLQHYWTVWLHRLQKYYVETAKNDDNENTRQ